MDICGKRRKITMKVYKFYSDYFILLIFMKENIHDPHNSKTEHQAFREGDIASLSILVTVYFTCRQTDIHTSSPILQIFVLSIFMYLHSPPIFPYRIAKEVYNYRDFVLCALVTTECVLVESLIGLVVNLHSLFSSRVLEHLS